MSLAILGTGTDVGKTVVAALVLARYRAEFPLAYWKPIASGLLDGRDTDTVQALVPGILTLPESYLFPEPLSPHLAARLAGQAVDPQQVVRDHARHCGAHPDRALVVEGAGGVLVPLTDQGDLLIDLMAQLALPCLVVGHSTLGTINHTLLTLEALRRRRMEVAGVVLSGPPNPENQAAIARWGAVEVHSVAPCSPLTAETLGQAAQRFDPTGRLGRYLRTA